jgi:ubiquinone/menaquinone biosynthesis C-methylase UbiE
LYRASNVPVCDYEGSAWRTTFWPGREYEDRAERIALTHLLPPRGKRLIEIGAGFGRLAGLYRGYEQVILLDYAHSMLQEARARLGHDPRFIFAAADLYNMPLADNAFDTVVTVRVLHHVADVPCAFGEFARILRPRGAYVTDFANKRHLKAMLKYWLGRGNGNSPFSHVPYEFVKLNFDYHPRYIRHNLEQAAFAVRDQRAVSTFRVGVLKRVLPVALLAWLDGLMQHPTSNLYLSPSIFLRAESGRPGAAEINPALWRCLRCEATSLDEQPDALLCRACGAVYPCVDGIYDFKIGSLVH